MVLKADRERVKTLLKDTITLLCKNGLEFKSKFSLEALIGVTLDEGDVMLISINEMVKSDSYRSSEPSDGEGNAGGSPRRKKRKRTHKRRVKTTDEFVVSGDEANTDSDGSSNSGAEPLEPVEKKPCEDPNACDDKSGGDLVFVKQEVPDGWDSGSVSHNLPSTSVGNQGQDNFAALPDIGLTEIDGGEGASWMLSAQEQSDIAQLSGSQNNLGTSALTSSQDGAQMFDQQQSQVVLLTLEDKIYKKEEMVDVQANERNIQKIRRCKYEDCSYSTPYRSCMIRHQKRHLQSFFSCPECDKKFIEKYDLKMHMRDKHEAQGHVCNVCGAKLQTRGGLLSHERKHRSQEMMIDCPDQGHNSRRIESNNEVSDVANEVSLRIIDKKRTKELKTRKCNVDGCSFTSFYRSSIIRHRKRCHSKENLPCPKCDRSFVEKYNLDNHIAKAHGDISLNCEYCGKMFTTKSSFLSHQARKCKKMEQFNLE